MLSAFFKAGFDPLAHTYGYARAVLTRFQNPGRAKDLSARVVAGDVIVGHSNGCTLTYMASKLGAPIRGAVFINPALDTDLVLAPQVEWVNLYTNAYDVPVKLAGLLCKHPWGPQGRCGISVKDDRYKRFQTELGDGPCPPARGHSAILRPAMIGPWTDHIIRNIEARLGN
jgi:hypothetical protein